jgi:AcrR family transcriptional regulator
VTARRAPATRPPRRSRNRRGEGGQLRDEILAAAAGLLLELQDEEKVTVRSVAAAVGVSAPSVYLHFPDKGSLIFAVCEALFAQLDDHIEAAVAGIDDPIEEMQQRALAYVHFGIDHPEQYRVLFMSRPSAVPDSFDATKLLTSAAFAHLFENVEAVLATGAFVDGLDPYRLALEMWAVVHGHTSLRIGHPDFAWPPVDEMVSASCAHQTVGLLRRD